jgi:hypothetical protein
MSAHACREHHHPVTWRGTGCPWCDAAVHERRVTRQRRRAAQAAKRTERQRRSDTAA